MGKTRYALIGTGGRAKFFYAALVSDFKDTAELVAFCDVNQTRMDFANRQIAEFGVGPLPTYKAEDFEKMIKEVKPDKIIVTTVDRTHHRYIIKALELGLDVVSEKPMTVDAVKCQAILDTAHSTGGDIRVTFNYRYAPHNTKVRELIKAGTIGQVNAVHFEWLLNTKHGADYFRRWHRDKRNSGGLLVHKSTHHFDLVNFWLGSKPKTVYAQGGLKFYGKENAEERGVTEFYTRSYGSEAAKKDHFALDLTSSKDLKELYLDAEKEDQYYRDQSVFGDGISIEDTLALLVNYDSGAFLTYSLHAYAPWEGFRVAFNGTKGRIELDVVENSYVNSGSSDKSVEGSAKGIHLKVFPQLAEPYEVEVVEEKGGHGGGDPKLLRDVFGEPEDDDLHRAANHIDGAWSILTGIAGNKSLNTGLPVVVKDLVEFH